MKHPDQETLSQLMDGEWQGLDVRRCVLDACHDRTLRAKWSRYHLARDAMRREALGGATVSLAERISAALEREPAYSNVTAIGRTGGAWPAKHSVPASSGAADDDTADDDAFDGAGDGAGDGTPDGAVDGAPPAASRAGSAVAASGTGASTGSAPAAGVVVGAAARALAVPAVGVPPRRGAGSLRTVATGFGLAASVALVTVLGLDAWQGGPSGEADDAPRQLVTADATPAGGTADVAAAARVATAGADASVDDTRVAGDAFSRQFGGAPLPEVELVANTGAFWSAPGSATRRAGSEERLNMFLSQHIENSPTAERQGMLPYSRLVGYDERAPER